MAANDEILEFNDICKVWAVDSEELCESDKTDRVPEICEFYLIYEICDFAELDQSCETDAMIVIVEICDAVKMLAIVAVS